MVVSDRGAGVCWHGSGLMTRQAGTLIAHTSRAMLLPCGKVSCNKYCATVQAWVITAIG